MQKAFGSLNAQPSEESIAEAQQLFAETQVGLTRALYI